LLPQSTLNLYPNPANRVLFLNYNNTKLQNTHYQIVDIYGRLVKEDQLQSDIIDISTLIPGIYLFKFQSEKKYLTIKFSKI